MQDPNLPSPLDPPRATGFLTGIYRPEGVPLFTVHSEIALNYIRTGSITFLLAGEAHEVPPQTLIAYWGGMPHRISHFTPGTQVLWANVPVPWVLQWKVEPSFVDRTFQGRLLVGEGTDAERFEDGLMFTRWVTAYWRAWPAAPEHLILEIEARVLRMSQTAALSPPADRVARRKTPEHVRAMVEFVARSYAKPISVTDVADVANLHPVSAMRAFRRWTGVSLWDYVLRLRVAHARRLLLTTSDSVPDVAFASGFQSLSGFYDSFRRLVGRKPTDERAAQTVTRPT